MPVIFCHQIDDRGRRTQGTENTFSQWKQKPRLNLLLIIVESCRRDNRDIPGLILAYLQSDCFKFIRKAAVQTTFTF